jgi:Flp pilus assembly protein TadD
LNLGLLLDREGKAADAQRELAEAVRLRPDLPEARTALGGALAKANRPEEAAAQFRAALAIDPSFAPARYNLERIGGVGSER